MITTVDIPTELAQELRTLFTWRTEMITTVDIPTELAQELRDLIGGYIEDASPEMIVFYDDLCEYLDDTDEGEEEGDA